MKLTMVSGTSLAYNANAYQVTGGEWDPTTIQWTNKPAADVLLESNISNNDRTKYQFSVLTAVQHWYDGDPTGQNENYGIMLRYYDETLTGYYNSVYSGDVVDTNSRPRLTISYNLAETADVLVGSSYSLLASSAASAYNWTSADSSIASVSTTGVVTVHKAGEVKVTASSGSTVWKEYTVYGYIENGVYYIKSATAGLYLGTYGGTAENTLVKLLANATSGDAQMRQLWRIVYMGKGYYSIRPMYKAAMGLHASGTNGNAVDIVTIGNKDNQNDVGLINAWGISSGSGGRYKLNHVNTSYLALRPLDGAASPGLGVTTGQDNGSELRYEWDLIRVTGLFVHDSDGELLNLANPIEVEVEMGETCSVSEWPYMITPSNVTITWSTQNADLSVNAQGSIYASKRGEGVVTATATSGSLQYALTVNVTSVETIYVKNYYDSTYSGNTEKINKISTAVSFLNNVYYEEFYLKFEMDGPPVQYEYAGVDICPNGSNECNGTCGTLCLMHHKNVFRIADELYTNYFEPNHIVVMWSDSEENVFCDSTSEAHSATDVFACVIWLGEHPIPVIQVLRNDPLNEKESMAINLAHEVAHTLGLKEIYLNKYNDDEECIATNSEGKIIHTTRHACMIKNDYCIMKNYNCNDQEMLYFLAVNDVESALCDYCIDKLHTRAISEDVYES